MENNCRSSFQVYLVLGTTMSYLSVKSRPIIVFEAYNA